MSMAANTLKLNFPCKWALPNDSSRHLKLARCMPVHQQMWQPSVPAWNCFCNEYMKETSPSPIRNHIKVDSGIMCESCSGRGWLLCDICNGQKTNVKAENNRIYRRCPACRATGCILCSKCKVFRCVTFPDHNDGDELIL